MPPRIIDNLFNFSVSTSRPGTKGESGTGFGMPLVRKFVEAYEGSIEIISIGKEGEERDHGTEMIIHLKTEKP